MGRVRTKTVKKSSKAIIERYYPLLSTDFETNKRICDNVAIIASKKLRNKIAGYTTHLMRRIANGPVRGISFKLQEEERERKDQYAPEISALDYTAYETEALQVDEDTFDLVKSLGFNEIPLSIMKVTLNRIYVDDPKPRVGRPSGDRTNDGPRRPREPRNVEAPANSW
ncbi:40S ribosomal protein S17 [Ascobolus immersus RN42]|uniref:40S ribosomal protein S17 n=1 Tax=Ascobolus immersus RN42 TaxID=1160509 RepID=A0A3N4IN58_ASCIM|nr:40S ribosomal protein S17 [Ascobolus immersus RN42]